MNKAETKTLLDAISAIDNRKLTQQMIDGWADILRGIPLDVALEAHRMARKNDAVQYLEPKHIISYAREAAFALDRVKPKVEEPEPQRFPMPNCRDHNMAILTCDPCCARLNKFTRQHGFERVHAFAVAEIYA